MNKKKCCAYTFLLRYIVLATCILGEIHCLSTVTSRTVQRLPHKPHAVWVKGWLKMREDEGFCVKLMRELRDEEPAMYKNFVRMTHEQLNNLCRLVAPFIEKKNTHMRKSIFAVDRLVLTLRYLATWESFRSLQYLFRIPQSTISRIIPEVLDAIYKALVDGYLQTPTTPDAWEAIAKHYYDLWNYPNCVGAVDGKHVVMVATLPPNFGSVFYNYKGTHSIVLMGIADAEFGLIYIDVGRNGRSSDRGVFNTCSFGRAMDSEGLGLPLPIPLTGRELPVPYVLVADDAFALKTNLMKPYAQRIKFKNVTFIHELKTSSDCLL